MPLQSQSSDTIKRLSSLFRTIPSAAMPEHRSFQALPIGNSDRRAQQEDKPQGGDESEGHDDDDDEEEEEEEEEEGEEKDEEEQQRKRVSEEPSSELRNVKPPDEAQPRESNSETLVMRSSIESVAVDWSAGLQASSTPRMDGKAESKEQSRPLDKQVIAGEAVQAAQNQTENQLQESVCSKPLSELSPSLSSLPSSTVPEQRLSPQKINNVDMLEADGKNSSAGKTLSAVSVARTSASDGYNWRKYGQKQVKSPTGSRSYYRCTHSGCGAKKIEFCNHLGHVIEITYRSQHSHEPPGKTNSIGEIKFMSSNEPTVETSVPEQTFRILNDADPSPSIKEPLYDVLGSADKKRQDSSGLSENGKVILKEEHVNEPELKRRVKKGDLTYLDSHVKPGKKSRFVVHAAGDVGVSGDGYRWRKYGQKMVKGNPHPRNYYRCTSAGCPVRKQIETAVDNPNAVIITYKGAHDHDMPVPKKRHGPPSAPLVAAASPASPNNLHPKNSDSMQSQKCSTQWSVDSEGELNREALDLGGERAIESARALLSIGFEIKPC